MSLAPTSSACACAGCGPSWATTSSGRNAVKGTGSRRADQAEPPGVPDRFRRVPDGFRRGWPGLAWAVLSLLNVSAMAAWPAADTIPFHLLAIGFTALYWLRIWPADP